MLVTPFTRKILGNTTGLIYFLKQINVLEKFGKIEFTQAVMSTNATSLASTIPSLAYSLIIEMSFTYEI